MKLFVTPDQFKQMNTAGKAATIVSFAMIIMMGLILAGWYVISGGNWFAGIAIFIVFVFVCIVER